MTVLLTRRAVVQTQMETTYDLPAPLGVNDGLLVNNPLFTVTPNVLEREFVRDDLSPLSVIIGRKIARMTFETELRGNGKQNSGNPADAALIVRLFRACGYQMLASATSSLLINAVLDIGDHVNEVAWANDVSAVTNTNVIAYYIDVDTAGASGAAKVTVTSDTAGEGSASQVITSGTVLSLGTFGLKLTPTFTGALMQGDRWVLWLLPPGITMKPRSDQFESITLGMHRDGTYHLMPGAFGTFEINATAGAFATISWTFTGTYVAPVDDANPMPIFERTLPEQVELARLRIDEFNAIVEKFTFNQGNDIVIRPDVSSSDGYIGTRITSRKPEGGIDPEADLVANFAFWDRMAAAVRMPFQMRVGTKPGNTIWFFAPNTQYTGLTYQDRNGILAYDAGLRFARSLGNDETIFHFC